MCIASVISSVLFREIRPAKNVEHRQLTHFVGDCGVVKSTKKAAKIYKRAVELGDAEAASRLAVLYAAGDGVKLDKNKALQLWRTAADRGYAHAQAKLAEFLEDNGSPHEETFRLLELAAKQRITQAEYNVGERYVTGRGVTQDLEEAKRWFARAAAKGHDKAVSALEQISAVERGEMRHPRSHDEGRYQRLRAQRRLARRHGPP